MRRTVVRVGRGRCLALVAAVVVLLAGCDVGVTDGATEVGGSSVRLTGRAHSDDGGDIAAWFEYGPTAELGSATPEQLLTVAAGTKTPVTAVVTGLAEGTTYHYRTCVRTVTATKAICGATATVTTWAGQDTVVGVATGDAIPELGYVVGIDVEVRSGDGDGDGPAGRISTSPGLAYFRWPDFGPVTCVRVEGSEATIALMAERPNGNPAEPVLVHVSDGGPGGADAYGRALLPGPLDTCPDPASSGIALMPLTDGDVIVHDGA